MVNNSSVKNLVKILIGAAWIDGRIQPEERQYLRKIAQEKGVANEPEIQPLLYELVPVQPEQFYEWVKEYLGDRPSQEDSQNLMEAISGLIYSDGEVAIEEAKLLTKLQQLSDTNDSSQTGYNAILKQIQKLYRRWVEVQN
ncbi:MAG: TerB family tellurite resistance protein [Scytonema sp. RU_4_4]|nr:TerB family tellurite resistance protein [Scytonema sp. RU_4_4]NJR75215.1 TerB family tellurite resistance protein [Scytonema sp. CRU_2_7]